MQGSDSPARILTQCLDQDAEAQAGAFIDLQATKTSLWPSCPSPASHPIYHDAPCTVSIQCSLIPSLGRIHSPRGVRWYWTSATCKWAGSRYKCSCNHIIAYTMIVLHCRIKSFFHIKCRSQTQSPLYLLTHFIKFTSFLLCLCTSVPSAMCTKSY